MKYKIMAALLALALAALGQGATAGADTAGPLPTVTAIVTARPTVVCKGAECDNPEPPAMATARPGATWRLYLPLVEVQQ